MKIKRDFVTNSSSTSFMITCKYEASGKDEFIEKFNRLLKDYIKDKDFDEEFQEPPLLTSDMVDQTGSGEFTIRDFVPIYCGKGDTPQYIQEFFLNQSSAAYKSLEIAGIKFTKAEIKDLNE